MKRLYTDQQIEFVRECMDSGMSTRQCAKAFTDTFDEPLSQTCLRRLMDKNSIRSKNRSNAFEPIGTERYSSYYDCMMVKVGDYHLDKSKSKKENDHLRNRNWALKQNIVWEKATGRKLKWREVVIFLDGDRTNYSPENLYAVPMNVAGTIEKMRMHSEDPDIYKTALIWGELYFLLKNQKGVKE